MSNVNYVPEFMTRPLFVEMLFSFRQYGDFLFNTIGVLKTVYSLAAGNVPMIGMPDKTILDAYSVVMKQVVIINDGAKKKLKHLQDRADEVLVNYPDIPMQEFHNNVDKYTICIKEITTYLDQLYTMLGTERLNPDDLLKNIGESCVFIPK